ncbi:expressed protein [Chlorella variabilis]|uniref:Expressed protein n=1 Tax=Chlorella variabilis TaxID=554065 RepID=E1Z891_CHLVA|nr:expressed protein [Chlorella variabilis]EFN58305.1 expressed protein [Chlorella variabilis]|eukprot:XP_005850407.1 expressed protein [Chlorella variabilis]
MGAPGPPRKPLGIKQLTLSFCAGATLATLLHGLHAPGYSPPSDAACQTSGVPPPVLHGCSSQQQSGGPSVVPPLLPPLPWEPLLTAAQLRRGLSFYGSGARIERVAAKLLAGQPITAVTLGASVTRGHGASSVESGYPSRFFDFLNASFPHRDHVLLNKGIGATNSGIYAVCFEKLVPAGADLVVVEFTFNEHSAVPFPHPTRRGFEQLLRKLLRLPASPAVIVLHHYAWFYAYGDGVEAGLYYRPAEAQLSTLAQYYDIPAPSVRNALYRMMQADVAPYKARPPLQHLRLVLLVSRVLVPNLVTVHNRTVPSAEAGTEGDYFYKDIIHPADSGHQAMAELLAGVVQTALLNVAAAGGEAGETDEAPEELPPPMIPRNLDHPTSVCAMQEDFQPVAKGMEGFEYKAERPKAPTFVEQKWGYRGSGTGAWVELEISTQQERAVEGAQKADAPTRHATVHLGYLRSYVHMALARAECTSGCTCEPTYLDGLWAQRSSLTQIHSFEASPAAVTQHPRCRIRVTIVPRTADTPGGLRPPGAGGKFQLSAIMVAHIPITVPVGARETMNLR